MAHLPIKPALLIWLANTSLPVSRSVIVDALTPAQIINITSVIDDSNIPGDFVTNDTTLTIAGTMSTPLLPDDKVQVSVDGVNWFDATTSGATWDLCWTQLLERPMSLIKHE